MVFKNFNLSIKFKFNIGNQIENENNTVSNKNDAKWLMPFKA